MANDVTRTPPRDIEPPRSFKDFETFMADLGALRIAMALAREPTMELFQQLDAMLERCNIMAPGIAMAQQPGTSLEVGSYLAHLQAVFPNAGAADGRIYGQVLMDDVMSLRPPVAAVEIAYRRWRQKSRFLPSISEFLDEVKAAMSQMSSMAEYIAKLPAERSAMARVLGVDGSE